MAVPARILHSRTYTAVVSLRPGQRAGVETWMLSIRVYTVPLSEVTTEYLITIVDGFRGPAFATACEAIEKITEQDITDLIRSDETFRTEFSIT